MIHKIHASGTLLENGYALPGNNGDTAFDVVFPGDLRNCAKCHVNNSYLLPLPGGLLATDTPRELWSPMLPIAAACVGCHDNDATRTHMYSQTTAFGETCTTCHGQGMEFAVEKVHAR
jgi:OmcA/MtrC family decaheme c-type cytochrome